MEIIFRNVSFSYNYKMPNEKKALDDVSIDNYIHKYTQEAKNSLQIL